MGEFEVFAKVAVYLKDSLVLSGFVVFVGFLVLRQILRAGVIPVLQQGQGFSILRLFLSYGFVIGLAIVLLGMGLKYRELSEAEQKRAAAIIMNELSANAEVISELGKNTETLSRVGEGIAGILRNDRFKILSGLFPTDNISASVDEGSLTNLYIERFDWLSHSGLWENAEERRRTQEACASIVRFVDRTRSTVMSLSDSDGVRYRVSRSAYEANLQVLRKIGVVNVAGLAKLYEQAADVRVFYNRVVAGSLEYMSSVRAFCASLPPDLASLSAVLALERLTFRLLPSYRTRIGAMVRDMEREVKALKI